VVDYIDGFLSAFNTDPPRIYAAGPLSGRQGGEPEFDVYLPLSRVKEIGWRTYIEGSKGIPEREFNGPVVGLQEKYAQGILQLDESARARHGAVFKKLTAEQQPALVKDGDLEFLEMVYDHTVEGMYGVPEYGGNRNMVGWRNILFEGDNQPIGYTRKEVEELDEDYAEHEVTMADVNEFFVMILESPFPPV
jgi:hypothetical protein